MRRTTKLLNVLVTVSLLLACAPAYAQRAGSAKQRRPARKAGAPASKTYLREYLSGDRVVPINVNAHSVTVPIGLSEHGLTLIEFPANDPFYAQHPGDEKFVTIDKRSKRPTTDPLILRPGKGFVVQKGKPQPSTVITVQTLSGLVCSFVVYPVASSADNANSVAVTYDRDAVIAARRRMGLRVDLVPQSALLQNTAAPAPGATPAPLQTAALAPAPAVPAPTPLPTPLPTPMPTTAEPRVNYVTVSAASPRPTPAPALARPTPTATPLSEVSRPAPAVSLAPAPTPLPTPTPAAKPTPAPTAPAPAAEGTRVVERAASGEDAELERATRDEMNRVSASAPKLRFATPLHGLALAVGRSRFVLAGYRIEVVAVKNTLSEPIRLVPGQPEIFVESYTDDGLENSERLKPRALFSTLGDGSMLAPGATYFFAFAFEEPILAARDQLRVAVAQMNAADKPATASLVTTAR